MIFKYIKKIINRITHQQRAKSMHEQHMAIRRLHWKYAEQTAKQTTHRLELQKAAMVSRSGDGGRNRYYITIEINDLIMWLIKQNNGLERVIMMSVQELAGLKFRELIKEYSH